MLLVLAVLAVLAGLAWTGCALWWGGWPLRPGDALRASQRADALLREVLGAAEFQQLVRREYLDVPSPTTAGRIYRIPYRAGRVEVIDQRRSTSWLCLVPTCWLPSADMVLIHKLLIEGDESRYLRVANHFPTSGAGQYGWWPP
ncbi:MAG TPA: hypothetical protein VF310_16515 [Vicinamibacteria bacterium]